MIARRKTVLLLLFVLLAVALVGITSWAVLRQGPSSVQEESNGRTDLEQIIVPPRAITPGFKLYRNEEWGFEFEYPEDWILHPIPDPFRGSSSQFQLIGTTPEEKVPNTIVPTFLVNIVTQDFADGAAINKNNLGATTSTIMVGKTQGKKYEYNFSGQSRISIDLPFGEYRILLGGGKKHENAFDRILASFKFIESDGTFKIKTYYNEKYGFEMQIPVEWAPFENQGRLTLNNIPGQPAGDNLSFFIIPMQVTTPESLASWFSRTQEFTEMNAQDMFGVANKTYGEGFLRITDFSVMVGNKAIDGQEVLVQTIRCLKSDCYFLGWPQHRKEYYIKRADVIFKLTVITMQPETYFGLLDQIASTLKFTKPD